MGMKRSLIALIGTALIACLVGVGMAQLRLEPKVERWLTRIERELSEPQQRLLAERLVVIRVRMRDLLEDYRSDESAADEVYKGYKVEFAGKVVEVGTARGLHLMLRSPNRSHPLTVRCGFVGSKRDELRELRQGQTVTVQGDFQGKRGDIIHVHHCSLLRPVRQ